MEAHHFQRTDLEDSMRYPENSLLLSSTVRESVKQKHRKERNEVHRCM